MATYKDFDMLFTQHPIRKDVVVITDTQAIIRSIRHLVLTNHYETPFRPDIGSNIRKLLFEPVSMLTANYIAVEVKTTLEKFEPRAKIQDVIVDLSPDENKYSVTILFTTILSREPTKIQFFLTKLR